MDVTRAIKQKSYEHIIYILHRHPLTFVPNVALFILLLLIPVAVYFLLTSLNPYMLDNPAIYAGGVLLGSIFYLSSYLLLYVRFLDYYLDNWIVTNDRIVDIEQQGLFHRIITELDLFRIQDVTTEISGFLGTVFNYGNVTVTTASYNIHIVFKNVSYPNHIREELIKLADEDRKFHYDSN